MKKLFTLVLTALAACATTATAQDRNWDFTNWSEGTKSDLHTEALTVVAPLASKSATHNSWRAFEKWNATDQQEHIDHAYWWGSTTVGVDGDGNLYANGNIIAETAGLKWTAVKAGNLAIAVDYPETSLGTYSGPQYLWIGGSALTFVIPNVKPGARITMDVESHKPSDGRGLDMSINGTGYAPIEGSNKPKERTTCVWQVPSTLEEASVDVAFTNNNGCHVYNINVTEPTAKVDGAHFAYVYDSSVNAVAGSDDDDFLFYLADGNGQFANVTVDPYDLATATLDADALKACDAVVISSTIAANNAQAATLRSIVSYVPVLNMSAALYEAWQLGTPATFGGTITVPESEWGNSLFEPGDGRSVTTYLDEDGQMMMAEGSTLTGVKLTPATLFANDKVLATNGGDVVAIHQHNVNRNSYLFLSYDFDKMDSYRDLESFVDIYVNAVFKLLGTKMAVPAVATPTIEMIYKNQATDVKITTSTKGSTIYYTTDGSEPTDASTVYTGIISGLQAGTEVKAIAYNLDGYVPSAVAEAMVELFDACEPPTYELTQESGKTTVKLAAPEEGVAIMYNLDGTQEKNRSGLYTDATSLVFTHPATLYAFTIVEDETKKPSEVVAIDVEVQGVHKRENVLSHFDGNAADWSLGAAKNNYWTEGGKNGYNYFQVADSTQVTTEVTETLYDEETGEEYTVTKDTTYWEYTYEPANKLFVLNPGHGWEFRTLGQGAGWENTGVTYDLTVEKAYRAETPLDFGATGEFIQFGNVKKSDGKSNDPYSAMLQSTEAFQGPFDVTCFISNGSSSNHPRAVVYIATDTLSEDNWMEMDTVWAAKTQRWHRKTVLSYNGTEKMFVRLKAAFSSVIVNDIIITNDPDEVLTPIRDLRSSEERGQLVRQEVFAVDGKRMNALRPGLNIVRRTYENGTTETRKVLVK